MPPTDGTAPVPSTARTAHRARTIVPALAATLVAAALAGCGLGAGRGTSDVTLTVSRDFGTARLGQHTEAKVPGSETVMRMLERYFTVQTKYGGGFVESIGRYSGSSSRLDWFYYVNGIQADKGAAATAVHRGDRVWWDLHDWTATDTIPAVVGSFPEPFLHGIGGKRYPTTLECAADVQASCQRVQAELRRQGIPVAQQLLGTGSGTDTLNVVVATWRDLRGTLAGDLVAAGPRHSGIYARFTAGGTQLQLMNPKGNVTRTLGPGGGLVAATTDQVSQPEWLVTGTDAAGVAAAAGRLTPAALRDRFAIAVQGAQSIPLPLQATL